MERDDTPLRTICFVVRTILRHCISSLPDFRASFAQRQSEAGRKYNEQYREITYATNTTLDNAAKSAAHSTPDESPNANSTTVFDTPQVNTLFGRTVASSEAAIRGELFPGRPLIRPSIRFKNKKGEWREECAKDYRCSPTHSPGLFQVVCACEHPKLLGVTVMDRSESVSCAITNLFTRFHPLPKVVFYDNACNMTKSIR